MKELDQLVENFFQPKPKAFGLEQLVEMIEQVMNEKQGKPNYGDISEGLFAMAVAYYLRYNKIDKQGVDDLRDKVGNNTLYSLPTLTNEEGDVFNVDLKINLKESTTAPLYNKKVDDQNRVDKITNGIVEMLPESEVMTDISGLRDKVLQDEKADKVKFIVEADGPGGETSKGNVKGDVEVRIYAINSETGQAIIDTEADVPYSISLSLKKGNPVLGNLAPFREIALLLKWPGVKGTAVATKAKEAEGKIKELIGSVKGGNEFKKQTTDEGRNKVIKDAHAEIYKVYKEFAKALEGSEDKPNFKDSVLDYYQKHFFGKDQDAYYLDLKGFNYFKKSEFDALRDVVSEFNVTVNTEGESDVYVHFYPVEVEAEDGETFGFDPKLPLFTLRLRATMDLGRVRKDKDGEPIKDDKGNPQKVWKLFRKIYPQTTTSVKNSLIKIKQKLKKEKEEAEQKDLTNPPQ